MPAGYNQAMLTVGMHCKCSRSLCVFFRSLKEAAAPDDNPVCKGTVTLNGNELFSNFGLGEMTTLAFTYNPGDVLRLAEEQTCILHVYKLEVSRHDVAGI